MNTLEKAIYLHFELEFVYEQRRLISDNDKKYRRKHFDRRSATGMHATQGPTDTKSSV